MTDTSESLRAEWEWLQTQGEDLNFFASKEQPTPFIERLFTALVTAEREREVAKDDDGKLARHVLNKTLAPGDRLTTKSHTDRVR